MKVFNAIDKVTVYYEMKKKKTVTFDCAWQKKRH